jgi:polyhydroxybutyrate depolymerase
MAASGVVPVAAAPCEATSPCVVADGRYVAALPATWDGHARMPLLLFLHGYTGTGEAVLADQAVAPVAKAAGFLLVAPDGAGGSWAHVGSPSQARDDIAFLKAVLANVRRRWPVDPRLVVAGGFSQGASMVWDLACYDAGDFTAFLTFSGGFWQKLPHGCTSGRVNLRHVHGTADPTFPMAGRTILQKYRQGDILQGLAIWRTTDRCTDHPDQRRQTDGLDCAIWSRCASGAQLQFCRFPGGHEMQGRWLADGLAWARGLAP